MLHGLTGCITGLQVTELSIQQVPGVPDTAGITLCHVVYLTGSAGKSQPVGGLNFNEPEWPLEIKEAATRLLELIEHHVAKFSGAFEAPIAQFDPGLSLPTTTMR